MWYQIYQYIKFIFKSKNQHGVHSPFIYNLVTTCFYDRSYFDDYIKLLHFRKTLIHNKTKIKVTDLGVGSQVMSKQIRQISDMARNAGTTKKRVQLLYRITHYFKPKYILELGTSLGIATHAMSLGYPESKITTIEGCPNISSFTKKNFKKHHLSDIKLLTGNFDEVIKTIPSSTFDLIFFDGNHQKKATLNYFEQLLKTAHNDSVFIFDDIYWSKDMTAAWETIKQHPKVTITVDTFFWGFVFFRKEQVKEHFIIRV
ncbi:O-methyltransferase [Changchengzhania lutea]|uniref:O-methyltransferase n=1 Tax=Changchengzhania lutea TaxID=2049305 RepID=UPI00115ED14A|nr:class I SAM-dependent methyltransferase [Changchengzhania lutea]